MYTTHRTISCEAAFVPFGRSTIARW